MRIVAIAGLACTVVCAQQQIKPKEDLELPIPLSSPQALRPGTISALSAEEKVRRALRNTISPKAVVNRVLGAGWDHLTDDPEEWSNNPDGFGQRFAGRMGRLAVRQGVQLAADLAFGIDPRYDRCDCTSAKSRAAHAWRRVLVSRRDNGSEMFAVSTVAGAYVPPLITDQWYPASKNTWEHKLISGSTFLALRGATNMLREFWPEISRKLPIKRFKTED
jgi:hypothetical protein